MKRQFKSCGIASKKHLGRLKKLNEKDTKTEKELGLKKREAETERKTKKNTLKNMNMKDKETQK
jgi:hypothetical protein